MTIKERIEEIRGYINNYEIAYAMSEIIDLANEYGYEEVTDDIIDTDYLDELVKARLEQGGWQGIACMLANVDSLNESYYLINGYGNIEEFHISDCEMIIDELEGYLKEEIEEEEGEIEEE